MTNIIDNPPPAVKAMQNLADAARVATTSAEAKAITSTISREFVAQAENGIDFPQAPDANGLHVEFVGFRNTNSPKEG